MSGFHNTKAIFRDLNKGDTFDFADSNTRDNRFYDRCRKVSPRGYVPLETGIRYNIGSTNCQVFHVEQIGMEV